MWKRSYKKCFLAFSLVGVFVYFVPEISQRDHWGNLNTTYTIETPGCKIPYLEINNKDVVKYFSEPDWGYTCAKSPPVVTANETGLQVDWEALRIAGIDPGGLRCSYRPFWRVEPRGDQDDNNVEYGPPVPFETSAKITDSYVKVECRTESGAFFQEYYSFVPNDVWKGEKAREDQWNVLILGVDTVSRLHLRRTMPRTVDVLGKIGAVEMLGFNKVEDNTFPNLVPLLAQKSWLELRATCWPTYGTRFDGCEFIFSDFRRAGYATFFAEECSSFGIFNYLKKGWRTQPVDMYWNTFDGEANKEAGHMYWLYYPDCLGSRPGFVALLNHTEQVAAGGKTTGRPYFSFSWITTLAHNHYDTAALGDGPISEHLSRLESSGYLDRTILIFMSDHGYRWGALPKTHQGHLEERLPFLFVKLPKGFAERHPEYVSNLEINSHRLVTTYDLHATLSHLLSLPPSNDTRSVSLFRPIPKTRTCDSADIPPHYCTCFETIPVDPVDPIIPRVARFLIEHINSLLSSHPCSFLTLSEIRSATMASSGTSMTIQDYTVSFATGPNNATMSGTVRVSGGVLHLAGSVSRLDWYGNQSRCVNDPMLKLYCYCDPSSVRK